MCLDETRVLIYHIDLITENNRFLRKLDFKTFFWMGGGGEVGVGAIQNTIQFAS